MKYESRIETKHEKVKRMYDESMVNSGMFEVVEVVE